MFKLCSSLAAGGAMEAKCFEGCCSFDPGDGSGGVGVAREDGNVARSFVDGRETGKAISPLPGDIIPEALL